MAFAIALFCTVQLRVGLKRIVFNGVLHDKKHHIFDLFDLNPNIAVFRIGDQLTGIKRVIQLICQYAANIDRVDLYRRIQTCDE